MQTRYLIGVLVLSCFGPYLHPSVRMEQIVLYPILGTVVLWHLLAGGVMRYNTRLMRFCVLFTFFVIWGTASAILRGESILQISYLANLESYFQPLAILMLSAILLRRATSESLTSVLNVIILAMCAGALFNAAVALYHLLFGVPWFIEYFLPPRSESRGVNVWDLSVKMGRIIGTFATPLEGGAIYGAALIGATYLYYARALRAPYYVVIALGIIIGGILTVSKGFLVALGLVGFYHLKFQQVRSTRWVFGLVAVLIGGMVFFATVGDVGWQGLQRFEKYVAVDDQDSAVRVFTAGRYGADDAAITSRAENVLKESPVIGYGMQYKDIFDSGFLEPLLLGGLVGLGIYLGIFVELLRLSFGGALDRDRSFYARLLVVYVLIVSLGAPIITKNKFEVMLWLQVGVLSLLATRRLEEGRQLSRGYAGNNARYSDKRRENLFRAAGG